MAYYRAAMGGSTGQSLTPSNSSPATITSGVTYNATANGKAVSTITDITPSSSAVSVSADDIVHVGGSGVIVNSIPSPTSLTPSNSSPATISSGGLYSATANGKAVASVTDVTPSSTPTSVTTNDVVKIGGSGVIVDSIPTPTSLTPSDSSPATITSGGLYSATTSGTAIKTLYDITPSNSSPVTMGRMKCFRNIRGTGTGTTGYAIASYDNVNPSSTPVSKTTNDIVRFTGSGVIVDSVKTEQEKTASGSLTSNVVVTPDSGKTLSKVTVTVPSHSTTYTPAQNTSANDMGANHSYRYVNTSGMVTPTGNKDLGTFTTNASITGQDVAGYATASFTINVPSSSGIPSMTLKESARFSGGTTSISLTAGKYFLVMEGEGTGTPSISISGVTATNVIAVARSSGSTSRSFYAWTFTLSATKSVSVTGSGWTNRYTFTYT